MTTFGLTADSSSSPRASTPLQIDLWRVEPPATTRTFLCWKRWTMSVISSMFSLATTTTTLWIHDTLQENNCCLEEDLRQNRKGGDYKHPAIQTSIFSSEMWWSRSKWQKTWILKSKCNWVCVCVCVCVCTCLSVVMKANFCSIPSLWGHFCCFKVKTWF